MAVDMNDVSFIPFLQYVINSFPNKGCLEAVDEANYGGKETSYLVTREVTECFGYNRTIVTRRNIYSVFGSGASEVILRRW